MWYIPNLVWKTSVCVYRCVIVCSTVAVVTLTGLGAAEAFVSVKVFNNLSDPHWDILAEKTAAVILKQIPMPVGRYRLRPRLCPRSPARTTRDVRVFLFKAGEMYCRIANCRCIFVPAYVCAYGWVSQLQRSQQTSTKVTCQHFNPHFSFLSRMKRRHCFLPEFTHSPWGLRNPGSTGRITEVTSAFQGVSLLQEAASETWASVSCRHSGRAHLS